MDLTPYISRLLWALSNVWKYGLAVSPGVLASICAWTYRDAPLLRGAVIGSWIYDVSVFSKGGVSSLLKLGKLTRLLTGGACRAGNL